MESDSGPGSPLSEGNKALAEEIFRLMDLNHDLTINLSEAQNWWRNNFAKINARSFFETVDKDGNQEISLEEWLVFWERVKSSGYTNEDLAEELDNLKSRGAWVQYEINE